MKNQRGVTLIALVVTIVVLLILAGTAIAMLSGDDGIMTNANKSQAANTEGEIREKIKLAYSAVKTEISVQSALNASYNATTADAQKTLFLIAAREIGLTTDTTYSEASYNDGKLAIILDTTNKQIYFQYNDNKFGGATVATAVYEHNTINNTTAISGLSDGNQKIQINGTKKALKPIRADIVLATDGATLTMDPAQVINN